MLGAWGKVLRLSLAPTAVADVLAGLVLGNDGGLPGLRETLLLVGASLCVFHGGMALNDWADRELDAKVRAGRPIPSGVVRPRAVLVVALGLLTAGPALAFVVGRATGPWVLALAALVLAYDLRLRGPVTGPLSLGMCRAMNLGIGLVAAGASPLLGLPCVAYGAYVFTVSRLGRLEDAPGVVDPARPRRLLRVAAWLLLLVVVLPPYDGDLESRGLAFLLVGLGAEELFQTARRREWTPGAVEAAMGVALRRLLVFTAALCCLVGEPTEPTGLLAGVGILLGFPLSWGLRRVFPPS